MRFFLAVCLLYCIELNAQISCVSPPDSIHTNRLLLRNIKSGGLIGRSTLPTVTIDYDGLPKPNAGVANHAVWLSAKDSAQALRVAGFHGDLYPADYFRYKSGPTNGDGCGQWNRFWRVDEQDIQEHLADFADGVIDNANARVLAWPGLGNPYFTSIHGFDLPNRPMAPFYDANQDGKYDPYAGDYPHPRGVDTSVMVGTILWEVFHGTDTVFAQGVQAPPFEIRRCIWATSECEGDSPLNYAFFTQIDLENTSAQTFSDTRFGYWIDWVMGSHRDDMFGTKRNLDAIFGYQVKSDEPSNQYSLSYGKYPPVVAISVLNRPLDASMNFYKTDGIADPALELYAPYQAFEYENLLHSRWRGGAPLMRKWAGWLPPPIDSSLITTFAFDGDPFQTDSWSMNNENLVLPGLAYPLMIFELDTMTPGELEHFDFVSNFYRDTTVLPLEQLYGLFDGLENIKDAWQDSLKTICAPMPICLEPDCVWPADANHDGRVDIFDVPRIALGQDQSGPPRTTALLWKGNRAGDWATSQLGLNIKHSDANGNGTIDTSDYYTHKYFYDKTAPFYQPDTTHPAPGPDLLLQPYIFQGERADSIGFNRLFRIRVLVQRPDVHKLAMEITSDSTRILQFTQATAPNGFWFTDTTIYISNNKPDRTEFASISEKPILKSSTDLILRTRQKPGATEIKIDRVEAYDAAGNLLKLSAQPLTLCVGGGCTSPAPDVQDNLKITTQPNPFSNNLTINGLLAQERYHITLVNALGLEVYSKICFGSDANLKPLNLPTGPYFLRLRQISTGASRSHLVLCGQ
jgi:hypothetical protein